MIPYQRVALYILFDSLEADLIAHIRSAAKTDDFLTDIERDKALARISKNPDLASFGTSDSDLIISLDLGDKYEVLLRHCRELGEFCKYFRSRHANFVKLITVRNDIMHGRPLTMDQQVRALAFAQDLLLNPGVWPRLHKTYKEYSDNPAAFINRSIAFLDEATPTTCLHNLPVPEFDDTGWLPRLSLEQDLKRKILGRHPVITVQGEGGNGKTALALQVLHNLVRTNDHNFDAIIWTSAKSSTLTIGGIEEIEGATVDALEIMDAASVLEPQGRSPVERLTTFLSENRVLLAIDNYESIIGDQIRHFAQDVPGESKLLFTSRHPIGGDLTVPVGDLEKNDAFRYFHRLIQVYGLSNIYKSNNNDDFQRWLDRLSYKPLSIKWLILGIKSGLNGEAISAHPDNVLKFCLDNVLGGLNDEAQAVIFVLATLPVPAPPSVIRVVSNLTALQVVDGLAELNRYNLTEAEVTDDGSQVFALRPFARSFVHRLIKPKPEVSERILESYRDIEGMFQRERGAHKASPFSFKNYHFENRSQLLLSKDLRRAVDLAYQQQHENAEVLLEECKRLDPGYFENYRAEAMIAFSQNDLSRAIESIKTAIKIDDNKAKLHYLLGMYYLRIQESDLARQCFEAAIQLDPNFVVFREAARNEMIRYDFRAAQTFIDEAEKMTASGQGDKIHLVDIQLQLHIREIDYLNSNGEYQNSLPAVGCLLSYLKEVKKNWIDERTVEHLMKVIPSLWELRRVCPDESEPLELLAYLEERFITRTISPEAESVSEGSCKGQLKEAGRKSDFGFIASEGEPDAFVHISTVGASLWSYMIAGGCVSYDLEASGKGKFAAKNVRAEL